MKNDLEDKLYTGELFMIVIVQACALCLIIGIARVSSAVLAQGDHSNFISSNELVVETQIGEDDYRFIEHL
jgi:hypothetical protein